MTQNEAQTGRRQVVTITWLRILSVAVMICVFASFVMGRIALHVQAHPQTSLTNILIQDVLNPFSLLLVFGVAALIFNQTFAANPNESWIERFLKQRAEKS